MFFPYISKEITNPLLFINLTLRMFVVCCCYFISFHSARKHIILDLFCNIWRKKNEMKKRRRKKRERERRFGLHQSLLTCLRTRKHRLLVEFRFLGFDSFRFSFFMCTNYVDLDIICNRQQISIDVFCYMLCDFSLSLSLFSKNKFLFNFLIRLTASIII